MIMGGHIDIDGTYHPGPTGADRWCPQSFYNAEDDLWFDAIPIFTIGLDLLAVSADGLYKYDNDVNSWLPVWS